MKKRAIRYAKNFEKKLFSYSLAFIPLTIFVLAIIMTVRYERNKRENPPVTDCEHVKTLHIKGGEFDFTYSKITDKTWRFYDCEWRLILKIDVEEEFNVKHKKFDKNRKRS